MIPAHLFLLSMIAFFLALSFKGFWLRKDVMSAFRQAAIMQKIDPSRSKLLMDMPVWADLLYFFLLTVLPVNFWMGLGIFFSKVHCKNVRSLRRSVELDLKEMKLSIDQNRMDTWEETAVAFRELDYPNFFKLSKEQMNEKLDFAKSEIAKHCK